LQRLNRALDEKTSELDASNAKHAIEQRSSQEALNAAKHNLSAVSEELSSQTRACALLIDQKNALEEAMELFESSAARHAVDMDEHSRAHDELVRSMSS